MAGQSKRGHVRGSSENQIDGIGAMGVVTLTLVAGNPFKYTYTWSGPAGFGGYQYTNRSLNGAPYVVLRSSQATFTAANQVAMAPNVISGESYAFFVELRDLKGELIARSNVATGIVP